MTMPEFEQAKEEWLSHDEWQYADRDACWKFFYAAGQAELAEVKAAMADYVFPDTPLSYSVKELVASYKDRNESAAKFMQELNATERELDEYKKEADWIRNKLKLPLDTKLLSGDVTLAGTMHNLCANAHGYVTYIKTEKCDDKMGKIARQEVELVAAMKEIEQLRQIIDEEAKDSGEVILQLAQAQAENEKLREALIRLDGWLLERNLGGLMPDEKAALSTQSDNFALLAHDAKLVERIINLYSPDDTVTDYQDKMRELVK